jgi:hypothetical protein
MNNTKDNIVEKEEVKNNKLFLVLGIIIGILVLIGASYIGRNIMGRQNIKEVELSNKGDNSEVFLNGNTCYDKKDYLIMTKLDQMNAGSDILVKYKTGKKEDTLCDYSVSAADFEIKNNCSNEDVELCYRAQHFKYIKDNLLILDLGTGTSRSFEVYNLDTKERLFEDNYNSGLTDLDLNDNVLTYWRTTKDIPNKENCSKFDEYSERRVGSKIETKVTLDLTNLTKKEFSEFRCSYSE